MVRRHLHFIVEDDHYINVIPCVDVNIIMFFLLHFVDPLSESCSFPVCEVISSVATFLFIS